MFCTQQCLRKELFAKSACIKLLIIGFTSLLMACAYSPQQITINPIVNVSGESYGRNLPVVVVVEDVRENKIIGSRGGAYPATSIITVANDISAAIKRSAISKLAVQGFSVNTGLGISDEQGVTFKILLDELTYDKPKDPLDKKVYLGAAMRAEVRYRGKTFTGQYKTQSQSVALVVPNVKKNEKLINKLLSTTLERLFSDQKLQAFMAE